MQRLALFFFIFLAAGRALERSEFEHDGKLYTIVGAERTSRAKRETGGTGGTGGTDATDATTSSINECYQYTAIGGFANDTDFEGNPEALCDKKNKYTPCFLPFVFTEDGSMPKPSAVYDYCKNRGCKVTCAKSSHTCIRYSHLLNGATSNITYFCGDVQDTTDDVVLKTGKASDTLVGGIVREVVYCQNALCNSSPSVRYAILALSLPTVTFLLNFVV